MDFHGMKRKDLQSLCKKHEIPGNLKNSEMASRLASVFQENAVENKIPTEDSVEAHGIKVKKVTFSPDDDEAFEFTPSVKKCPRKNGRTELRRSKRNTVKGIPIGGSNDSESNKGREVSESKQEGNWSDAAEEAHKVPRRSKRIGCEVIELKGLDEFEDKRISKSLCGKMEITKENGSKLETVRRRSTRLAANLAKSCVGGVTSKQLIETGDKEDEIVKTNVMEVSTDFEVQETRKYHRKYDPQAEMVLRRSKRFAKVETNT